ncbi:hypothetical protein I3843_08G150800 [Carya illinoinensis]|nr:hypothetical protein I3843_08G150800 [Carya illinoinensis]
MRGACVSRAAHMHRRATRSLLLPRGTIWVSGFEFLISNCYLLFKRGACATHTSIIRDSPIPAPCSDCYFFIFSLFLTKNQDKVVVKVSYNQSKLANCSTQQSNSTCSHNCIVCLSNYTKTVSSNFPLMRNGLESKF